MEIALPLAAIMGPLFLMLGLSYLIYAKVWQKVYDKWQRDHLLLVPLMALLAIVGLYVVRTYNVWEWNIWLIVTITGWLLFVKALIYFLLPGVVLKPLIGLGKNLGLVYLGGIVCVVVGAVLTYYVYLV